MSLPALVKASREPTGTITAEPARIKLAPLGTPLRALARAHSDGRLVLEAELPWLQLGAACTAELADGRSVDGKVHWIGLDMTRSGTARLRILVDTQKAAKSIQLSVHDADVQELLPPPRTKRARWLLPLVSTVLAALAGGLASHVLAPPQPQLLPTAEAQPAAVARAPLPIIKIPAESLQLPLGDVAVVVPILAPGVPSLGVPSLSPPSLPVPAASHSKPASSRKPARKHR